MKKAKFVLLIFLFTISCISRKTNSKKQVNLLEKLRKGKEWEELLNSNYSDIPSFLKFKYSKYCKSIFASIIEMSEISNYFIKIPLNQNLKRKNFYLLGEPGQCPTCILSSIRSVSICDNFIAIGMFYKGYNFYDCNGNFLFQLLAKGCPSGQCYFYKDRVTSLPHDTGISDYAIYVFDLKTMKLKQKVLPKNELLKLVNFKKRENTTFKNDKVEAISNRLIMFDYAKIGSNIIMLPQANPKGTNEFFVISLKDFTIKKVSILKYRKCLNRKFPEKKVEVFSTITAKKDNIIVVRNILPFENCGIKKIREKYGFLVLLELNLKGDLLNVYIPPKDIFVPNCYGVAPIDIEYIGKDEYLLNEFQYIKAKNKKTLFQHLIRFKAKKLPKNEMEKLSNIL